MTTTRSDRPARPARQCRHARQIAELVLLIEDCARAAGAVFGPLAAAPPERDSVEVTLLPCRQMSSGAALALDRARAEDARRWPDAVRQEEANAARTHAARLAVARAEEFTAPADQPADPPVVPLLTVEQTAEIDLVSSGDEVAALWRSDPAAAIARVRDLTAGGELGPDEILDQAAHAAELAGLLTLAQARTTADPSTAAHLLLAAAPDFALAVQLLATDPD
ncbi:hypothetical protein [Kitasatospora sp. NRRL B-11411]|uniref:hypothetical protein n=1 Tax=Kitasatospora sp. NRRL B-11411 TaxID=1463822 RepID=UPI0005696324|nr:hypothetical protein [Kitasatospora sp. NRRL B-11411]